MKLFVNDLLAALHELLDASEILPSGRKINVEEIIRYKQAVDWTETAEKAFIEFLETVTEAIEAGKKVVFTGHGSFVISGYSNNEGNNPPAGKTIKIKATKAPKVKTVKILKKAVT